MMFDATRSKGTVVTSALMRISLRYASIVVAMVVSATSPVSLTTNTRISQCCQTGCNLSRNGISIRMPPFFGKGSSKPPNINGRAKPLTRIRPVLDHGNEHGLVTHDSRLNRAHQVRTSLDAIWPIIEAICRIGAFYGNDKIRLTLSAKSVKSCSVVEESAFMAQNHNS